MRRQVKYLLAVLIILLAAATATAQSQLRTIAVVYQAPKQDITDFSLVEKLNETLTMQVGLRVIVPDKDSSRPEAPNRRFDLERLLEWGREVGCRYIIYIRVDGRRIATRKQLSIPWVLSRYVVEGHLSGVYSLIDLNRSKVIGTWDLATRMAGPRQWQVVADYPGDPDLHMSAPRKLVFLQELERKAVDEIVLDVRPHLKGR